MAMNFDRLDALKKRLDGFRPLGPEAARNLHYDLVVRWTYNSNAIEGNTLTLKETKVALEGITIGGKTMREHFEAINHREAIFYVEDMVGKTEALTEWQIKSLHQLVLKNIDDRNAGRYRTQNVIISGAEHRPPDYLSVPQEMETFVRQCAIDRQRLHPVEYAARVHADFVKIHPFVDGNGRTARLLNNLELMKAGFPPAVLSVEHRLRYYEALDQAHCKGDYEPFLALMAETVEQAFEPYWYVLGVGKGI